MDNLLTKEEKAKAKPYILQILDNAEEKGIKKGMEKGMEKGIERGIEMAISKYLKKNPALPDVQVADILRSPPDLSKKSESNCLMPASD